MKYILLLLLFTSGLSFGVTGTGRFYAKDGDSLAFIKKQVLHQAFLNVIRKEATRLGLNATQFFESYENGFNEFYAPTKAERELKLAKNPEKNKKMRIYTLTAKRNYHRLDKVIKSFSIQKLSRSVQNPKLRMVKIKAEVDAKMLYSVYNKLVASKGSGSKYLNTLYIIPEFDLVNCSFVDLGVNNRKDFTDVIQNYWFNWLQENRLPHVENISFIERGNEASLNKNRQAGIMTLKIVIKKISTLDNSLFEISGNMLVVDGVTDTVIYSKVFASSTRNIGKHELSKVNSVLANHIYRMPLADFNSLKKTFLSHTVPLNTADIRVVNYRNLDQVLSFMTSLQNKGLRMGIKTKLERFGVGYADLRVFYNGEGQLLRNLLESIKTLKSGKGVKLVKKENPYQVSF